jgi:hypothetical protein
VVEEMLKTHSVPVLIKWLCLALSLTAQRLQHLIRCPFVRIRILVFASVGVALLSPLQHASFEQLYKWFQSSMMGQHVPFERVEKW